MKEFVAKEKGSDHDQQEALKARARVLACTAKGASAYLTFPHICGAWLQPQPFLITIRLRLGAAVGTGDRMCPNSGCRAIMDDMGDHALRCMNAGVRHPLHNAVRDYLAEKASIGLMQPLREHMCFLGKRERMDLVLRTEFGGKHALLDVAVTYPLLATSLSRQSVGPREAANAYTEKKWSR